MKLFFCKTAMGIQKNFVIFHNWVADLLLQCFNLIKNKNIYNTLEDYSSISEFIHPDFQDNGISANDIGRCVASMKVFQRQHELDLPLLIKKASTKQTHEGFVDWEISREMKPEVVRGHLEVKKTLSLKCFCIFCTCNTAPHWATPHFAERITPRRIDWGDGDDSTYLRIPQRICEGSTES